MNRSITGTTERIRKIIEESGLTQTQFARKIGVDTSNFSRFLAKDRMPQTTLEKIACYFDVNKDWLIYGDGNTYVPQPIPSVEPPKPNRDITINNNSIVPNIVNNVPPITSTTATTTITPPTTNQVALLERVKMLENENAWLRSVVESVYRNKV